MNKNGFISDEMMKVAVGMTMISKLLEMHNGLSKDDWIIRAQAADTLRVFIAQIHTLRKMLTESTESAESIEAPFYIKREETR